MTKDPVCGMNVDEQKTTHKSTYEGKVYAFCGAGCKASFDKAPTKYVALQSEQREC